MHVVDQRYCTNYVINIEEKLTSPCSEYGSDREKEVCDQLGKQDAQMQVE